MTEKERHHKAIWMAIEKIAEQHGLSPSGLAKRAGMDATAFNLSKRVTRKGRRWPSTETIAGMLDAVGVTWAEFGLLVDGGLKRKPRRSRGGCSPHL